MLLDIPIGTVFKVVETNPNSGVVSKTYTLRVNEAIGDIHCESCALWVHLDGCACESVACFAETRSDKHGVIFELL